MFTKKKITSQTLTIIDIGSFKLRICVCQFKNKKAHIHAYEEKRQNISDFANNECLNIPGLCENISELIERVENKLDTRLENIIINYPFGEFFLGSKQINYKRKHSDTKISIKELEDILASVEKLCLSKLENEVEKIHGLTKKDIQILLSRIGRIEIDHTKIKKIIGYQGSHIKITLINAFIPKYKHQLVTQIGNALGKKIFRILPSEYCVSKIFKQKELIIIDIGATHTCISYISKGEIVGLTKIPIGIHDLIQKISLKHHITQAEIIDTLSSSAFEAERTFFLSVWSESFGIALKELLGEHVCPEKIYIGGGGGNNTFFHDCVTHFPFHHYDIRSTKNVEFIEADISQIMKHISHISLEQVQKIPLEMYALILESNHLITREHDVLSTSLKKAIQNLGYIST